MVFPNQAANPLSNGAKLYVKGKLLTELVVPSDVISIPNYAFREYEYLEKVELSESVKTIGIASFQGCSSLKNIKFTNGLTEIGGSAFGNCQQLSKFTLPVTVNMINYNAFNNCNITVYYYEESTIDRDQYGGTINWIMVTPIKLTVQSEKEKHIWYQNEEFEVEGYNIHVLYNNDDEKALVLSNEMISGVDSSKLGEQEMVISYKGASTTLIVTVKEREKGDLNRDGKVGTDDAIRLLMHTYFPEDPAYSLYQDADYNCDDIVDNKDAIYLLMYVNFPEDYPLDPKKYAA